MARKRTELRRESLLQRPDIIPVTTPRFSVRTPQWIRDEFRNFPELGARANLVQVVSSPVVTLRTWETIFKEETIRLERDGTAGYAARQKSFLKPLANFIDRGIAGPTAEAKLTKVQRDAMSANLSRACNDVLKALTPFDDAEFFEWRDALMHAVMGLEDPKARLTALEAADDPTIAVIVLSKAAELWRAPGRRYGPSVPRPKGAGAKMLFLLRTLSAGFTHRYGKPLPSPSQQITGVFHRRALDMDITGVRNRLDSPRKTR